jgi:hypothetical protein
MIGTFVGIPFASALTENTKISADANFLTSLGTGAIMFDCARGFSTFSHGEWKNVSRRFLGLEFRINGENHFGWARLSVRSSASNCATRAILTGFAYETDPNRPINAGQTREDANTGEVNLDVAEPATLGRLARGTRLGASREH